MSFDETLIRCSAPSLCGIKPASLFSLRRECLAEGWEKLRRWRGDFMKAGRYLVPVKKDGGRFLMFVFDRSLLEKIICGEENSSYLGKKGYPLGNGLDGILSELLHRLAFSPSFPHEIGLFLGYPLCDVVGFEKDRFACKFSGLWKVYGNLREAERKMKMYRLCSESCMRMLWSGLSVPAVAEKYCKAGERL